MTRNRLILHIGTHKTGTSTLQALMKSQAEHLAAQGFHYARTDRQPFPSNVKHAFFGRALARGGEEFDEIRKSMQEEFAASGCHTMVVSAEGLASPDMSADMEPLRPFAEDYEIEIVCFLRRQDYFAESMWNQVCKMGKEKRPISQFISRPGFARYLSYQTMLDRWATLGKVTAIGFETARIVGLVETFAKVTGMNLPEADKIRNVSPSMTLAATLSVLNRGDDVPRWTELEPLLGPNLSRLALGSRLRGEILARYAEHNAKLQETYGVQFPDTMPDEDVEPIAEPSAEAIQQLLSEYRAKKAAEGGTEKTTKGRKQAGGGKGGKAKGLRGEKRAIRAARRAAAAATQ